MLQMLRWASEKALLAVAVRNHRVSYYVQKTAQNCKMCVQARLLRNKHDWRNGAHYSVLRIAYYYETETVCPRRIACDPLTSHTGFTSNIVPGRLAQCRDGILCT